MPLSSDVDDPRSGFAAAIGAFGLDAPSRRGRTVGGRALATIADGICDRFGRKEDPEGGNWDGNAPSTIARKGRDDANVETGAMGSRQQIEGDQSVARDEASMTYGQDDECRAKAHWAHVGQGPTRVLRPFYLMTDADCDAVLDGLADDIIDHLLRG
jgi:hypothetical protein